MDPAAFAAKVVAANALTVEAFGSVQTAFFEHIPEPSEAVRGNARAGCGKKTMAVLLCKEWLKRNPNDRIGYFVYNKAAEQEANCSKKFPKNVTVMTTHAYYYIICFRRTSLWTNALTIDATQHTRHTVVAVGTSHPPSCVKWV